MLVNTWTANDKYSLLNRDKWTEPIQMQISKKRKKHSPLFFWIFEICIKNWIFWKKIWPSKVTKSDYFLKNMTLKVFIFPKLRTAEDLLSSTAKKRRFTKLFKYYHGKRSQKLRDSTFIRFIDHCELNWVGKSLS